MLISEQVVEVEKVEEVSYKVEMVKVIFIVGYGSLGRGSKD